MTDSLTPEQPEVNEQAKISPVSQTQIQAQSETGPVVMSLIVPGLPHPLLAPEQSASWSSIRTGFDKAAELIGEVAAKSGADLLLILSTQWHSILGHQFQAAERLEWNHVDPEFHELGTIPYDYAFDGGFADAYTSAAQARGLHARAVRYPGFPIDTGTLVARKLLDPKEVMKVCSVSCNIYADRAEMIVLGKAAADALRNTGRKAIAVTVSALSNRLIPKHIDPASDHIALPRDDEWNRKILEILGEGRLEDVVQLARNFSREARADQKFKAIWWLSGLNGCHNNFQGNVLAYGPIQGTGAAVVTLTPTNADSAASEFDEDDVEFFKGERGVLSGLKS
jgi:2-aminophenol/2-amino-5-chlorophenol 1,6-dioxygenase alpha subunit